LSNVKETTQGGVVLALPPAPAAPDVPAAPLAPAAPDVPAAPLAPAAPDVPADAPLEPVPLEPAVLLEPAVPEVRADAPLDPAAAPALAPPALAPEPPAPPALPFTPAPAAPPLPLPGTELLIVPPSGGHSNCHWMAMSWLLSNVETGRPPPKLDQGSVVVPAFSVEPLLATVVAGLKQSSYCVAALRGSQSPGRVDGFAVEG